MSLTFIMEQPVLHLILTYFHFLNNLYILVVHSVH